MEMLVEHTVTADAIQAFVQLVCPLPLPSPLSGPDGALAFVVYTASAQNAQWGSVLCVKEARYVHPPHREPSGRARGRPPQSRLAVTEPPSRTTYLFHSF